jgi:hypothetical protein
MTHVVELAGYPHLRVTVGVYICTLKLRFVLMTNCVSQVSMNDITCIISSVIMNHVVQFISDWFSSCAGQHVHVLANVSTEEFQVGPRGCILVRYGSKFHDFDEKGWWNALAPDVMLHRGHGLIP